MQPPLPTNPKSLVPGAPLKADLESCLGHAESSHPEPGDCQVFKPCVIHALQQVGFLQNSFWNSPQS